MSSSGESRRSKASKAKAQLKKDRDLQMLAVMAPVITNRSAEARDLEDLTFNLMVARLTGGMNLVISAVLFIVCVVLVSIGCCGSHTKYDSGEWDEQCSTDVDKT